jgi:hypothetical protein
MYAAVEESTPPDIATAIFTGCDDVPNLVRIPRKAPVVHASLP